MKIEGLSSEPGCLVVYIATVSYCLPCRYEGINNHTENYWCLTCSIQSLDNGGEGSRQKPGAQYRDKLMSLNIISNGQVPHL